MSKHTSGKWVIPDLKDEIRQHINERRKQDKRINALLKDESHLKDIIKMALSEHGRTVEQAIDDVPLEEWEILATKAIAEARKGE